MRRWTRDLPVVRSIGDSRAIYHLTEPLSTIASGVGENIEGRLLSIENLPFDAKLQIVQNEIIPIVQRAIQEKINR
jgi:hypothetical protein